MKTCKYQNRCPTENCDYETEIDCQVCLLYRLADKIGLQEEETSKLVIEAEEQIKGLLDKAKIEKRGIENGRR